MIALPAGMLLAASLAAADGPRLALLVGNDAGLADEQPLRFTGADARRLAAVLQELGGFAPEDVRVLENRTAAEILDSLDALARRAPASTVLFFYSGHADAAALHPAGTLLPVDLLQHRLRALGADLSITILDACQSGGAVRPKGSRPAAPFQLRLEEQGSSGEILISSSAADEQSFEGPSGGLFTLHWTSALRGAADANADGQVTLGEAYEYAYAQTLRSTLAASAGPQHARFRYDLTGRRDPVLTRLSGGAMLTLRSQVEGEYVIFDGRERAVIAELPARPDQPRRLALAPGAYVIQQRGPRALRLARIELARGDDRVLSDHQLQEVPLVRLARKGSIGDRRVSASLGRAASGLGTRDALLGSAGVEWEGARWLTGVDLAYAGGDQSHRGLATRDTLVQGSGWALWSAHRGGAVLRVGPVGGLAWLRQATTGHEPRQAAGISVGARALVGLQATQGFGLYLLGDARLLATRTADGSGGPRLLGLGVVPWSAWSAGLNVAF